MKVEQEQLEQVDEWRSQQDDVPTRSEAFRRLVDIGLAQGTRRDRVYFSDGEKVLILMLRDFMNAAKVKGDVDANLLAEAIYGGHYWAPVWEMDGVFGARADAYPNVREVANVLDMWAFIERGWAKLSKKDKAQLKADADLFGDTVTFPGFDGNNEGEHFSITKMLVEKMGRWTTFQGRELNSHSEVLDGYRKMVDVFEPMRKTLHGTELSLAQLTELLKARREG